MPGVQALQDQFRRGDGRCSNLDGFDAHGAQVEYEPLDEARDEHMDFEGNSAAPVAPARWEGSTRLPPCEFSAFQQRFGRDPTPSEAELCEEDWDDIAPDDDAEAEAEATATEATADKRAAAAAAANTAGVRKAAAAAAAKGPFSDDGDELFGNKLVLFGLQVYRCCCRPSCLSKF